VDLQAEFNNDVKQAATAALGSTELAAGRDPRDTGNPWAVFDHYLDRVAAQCVDVRIPAMPVGDSDPSRSSFRTMPVEI
jgi:hypothetical protein